MSRDELTHARFAASAAKLAALGDRRVAGLRERLAAFVPLTGRERALDAGTGTGPIAFALAPLVESVVALDLVPEMLDQARGRLHEYPNVELVEGDLFALPYPAGSFDLALSGRTLHHLDRPAAVVAELTRVTRPGGVVVVIDQVAPPDASDEALHEQIERLRDPSHVRTLRMSELLDLARGSGLTVEAVETVEEDRDLGEFLDLASCTGAPRDRIFGLAADAVATGAGATFRLRREGDGFRFATGVGWLRCRR